MYVTIGFAFETKQFFNEKTTSTAPTHRRRAVSIDPSYYDFFSLTHVAHQFPNPNRPFR